MNFDGYTILRELHVSHRSHIHLARDDASGERVAIKTPSIELRDDPAYLERFLLEEWVARRIDSPHALHARPPAPRDAAPGPAARQHHDRCRRHGPHRRLRQRACRGLAEAGDRDATEILGTEQYTAPEYFLGEGGTPRSDQFSLGVITYQMLSGGLPYGARVSRLRSHAALTHPVAFWKGLTLALAAALLGLLYAWVMRA